MEILLALFLFIVLVAACLIDIGRDDVVDKRDKSAGRAEPKLPPLRLPETHPVVRPDHSASPWATQADQNNLRPVPSREFSGKAYVTDGDGLRIKREEIRLFGVDAPEFGHPYGKSAKWKLVELTKGQIVRVEVMGEDNHGRTVAKCLLSDGRDLSAEMVKCGLAIDWPKFSGGIYTQFEPAGVRKKLWLADARQKGRMHVWDAYEMKKNRPKAITN